MDLETITHELLDALERFDTDVLPLGLYASDELTKDRPPGPKFQEWHRALFPLLRSYGIRGPKHDVVDANVSVCRCMVPDIGVMEITLVKFSNIKVRKHGSGYHVDQHELRAERWQKINMSRRISGVWKPHDEWSRYYRLQARVLLLIGFDKGTRPLQRELSELERKFRWSDKGVHYTSRQWQDKAQRGFGVRLDAWAAVVTT